MMNYDNAPVNVMSFRGIIRRGLRNLFVMQCQLLYKLNFFSLFACFAFFLVFYFFLLFFFFIQFNACTVTFVFSKTTRSCISVLYIILYLFRLSHQNATCLIVQSSQILLLQWQINSGIRMGLQRRLWILCVITKYWGKTLIQLTHLIRNWNSRANNTECSAGTQCNLHCRNILKGFISD